MITKKQYVLIHAEAYYNNNDQILLVKKDRPEWQKGFLNLTGGKVEAGENLVDAVCRELKEETGYTPIKEKPTKMGLIESDLEEVHVFRVFVDRFEQPKPKPQEGETEIFRWFPWHHVKDDKRLMPNLRVVLPLLLMEVQNWKLYFWDSFRDNGSEHTMKITFPTHLHYSTEENQRITSILKGEYEWTDS